MKTDLRFVRLLEALVGASKEITSADEAWHIAGCPVVEEEPKPNFGSDIHEHNPYCCDACIRLLEDYNEAKKNLTAANARIEELKRGHHYNGIPCEVCSIKDGKVRNEALEEAVKAVEGKLLFAPWNVEAAVETIRRLKK